MAIDDTNSILNYSLYHTRDIHATVRELSLEQKQQLLNKIQLRKGVCTLTGREYDREECERIEKLLEKETATK